MSLHWIRLRISRNSGWWIALQLAQVTQIIVVFEFLSFVKKQTTVWKIFRCGKVPCHKWKWSRWSKRRSSNSWSWKPSRRNSTRNPSRWFSSQLEGIERYTEYSLYHCPYLKEPNVPNGKITNYVLYYSTDPDKDLDEWEKEQFPGDILEATISNRVN